MFVIFGARLTGLWMGGYVGSVASGFKHPHLRGFGLVTQLAIALSLVQRIEDQFPEALALAQTAQGMVLFGLMTGPALLVAVLKLSGEAGLANQTSASVVSPTAEGFGSSSAQLPPTDAPPPGSTTLSRHRRAVSFSGAEAV